MVAMTFRDKRVKSQTKPSCLSTCLTYRARGTCRHSWTGRSENGRPVTGTGAGAEPGPARRVLIIPGSMAALGLSTGVLYGAGLVLQVGLGWQGHLPSVTELLGGVNGGCGALRLEQGGGEGGEADDLGFWSRWESVEMRNTGAPWDRPGRLGLSDFSSWHPCCC